MKSLILYIIIVTTLFSCTEQMENQRNDFIVEIPDSTFFGHEDFFYEVKKKATSELNLTELENGVDHLELRLWTKVETGNWGEVFVIKKVQGNWSCLRYFYTEKFPEFENDVSNSIEYASSFAIDSFNVRKIKPQSSWAVFFDSLESNDIYILPVQSEIEGWENRVSDGNTFYIEFADTTKYRFYWYNCPDAYEDEFEECKKMTNILENFHRELGMDPWMGFRCKRK